MPELNIDFAKDEIRLPILYNHKPCYEIVYATDFSMLREELTKLQYMNIPIAVITDSNVGPLYEAEIANALKENASTYACYTIPAGEENKNLNTIQDIYRFLITNHYDRSTLLIALGGGVVGDMTGYVAATYLRGIDFIQIPTTLLAQADSSIGGKTGVDLDGYKNMVGAFKMPKLVYANVATLNSLDGRQFASGFAEIMKHGLIKDAKYYSWLIDQMYEILEKDPGTLREMLYRSNLVKKAVVEKDPFEHGDRMLLNFGHTIGHAIEKYENFTMTHGECVALGCIAAAYISYKRELLSTEEYYEIRDMFVPFYLPITVDDLEIDKVLELTHSDKKMKGGHIRFVLLKKLGKAYVETDVTDEEIRAAIEEVNFVEDAE